MFYTYFELGMHHIADINGYDHIIFLVTLCAAYGLSDWKKLILLITAFTLGHTITLALATLQIVKVNSYLIEILIPVSILIMGIINLVKPGKQKFMTAKYITALLFGLIHGLGFSNYLRMLLTAEYNITVPLFGFNVGVEAGQILIVGIIFILGTIVYKIAKYNQRDRVLLLSGAGIGTSLIMIIDRI